MVCNEDAGDAVDNLLNTYRKLSYEQRNVLLLKILLDQFSNQKYLIYGWPIQRLYSQYASNYLPQGTRLRILELGPGDNLMTAAMWMMEERVESLTLMDMFKGAYIESSEYHQPMYEMIKMIHHLRREGFNNDYPCTPLSTERLETAIKLTDDGVHLDPEHLRFVITQNFEEFPLEANQFNYIYSHATLEHYLNPEASIKEMYRVLEIGGLMVHQIDIRDHRYFDKDPFRYLEQTSAEWNYGDLCFPVNQWRAFQFEQAFRDAGFEIIKQTKIRREPEKLKHVKLASDFADIPKDAIAVTGVAFVLRKK